MDSLEASVQRELMKRKAHRDPLGFKWWAIPIEDLWELLETDETEEESNEGRQ